MHTDIDHHFKLESAANNTVPESDQWKLNGDCKKCRRKEHCHKQCSAKTRADNRLVSEAADLAISLAYKQTFGKRYY